MNYAEMSDYDINEACAKVLGKDMGGYFCPCWEWSDAGPIIVSNLIALKPVSMFVGGHRWFATNGEGDFGLKAADNNPLRAAMIVFLMMQEGK